MNDKNRRPSLDIAFAEMTSLQQFQSSANKGLDKKAGMVLFFSGTILAILAGNRNESVVFGFVEFFGSIFLLLSVFLSIWAFWVRSFRYDPKPSVLLKDYMFREPNKEGDGAKEQILADKVDGYQQNEKIIITKVNRLKIAATFLGVGVAFVTVGIFLN